MNKDKLLAALNALQNGNTDAEDFRDEIETIITLIVNAKDEDIAAAWEDYHTDK